MFAFAFMTVKKLSGIHVTRAKKRAKRRASHRRLQLSADQFFICFQSESDVVMSLAQLLKAKGLRNGLNVVKDACKPPHDVSMHQFVRIQKKYVQMAQRNNTWLAEKKRHFSPGP